MVHCMFRPDGRCFGSGAVPVYARACLGSRRRTRALMRKVFPGMLIIKIFLPAPLCGPAWLRAHVRGRRILLRVPADGFELGFMVYCGACHASGHPVSKKGCIAGSDLPACAPYRALHLSCLAATRAAIEAAQSKVVGTPGSRRGALQVGTCSVRMGPLCAAEVSGNRKTPRASRSLHVKLMNRISLPVPPLRAALAACSYEMPKASAPSFRTRV